MFCNQHVHRTGLLLSPFQLFYVNTAANRCSSILSQLWAATSQEVKGLGLLSSIIIHLMQKQSLGKQPFDLRSVLIVHTCIDLLILPFALLRAFGTFPLRSVSWALSIWHLQLSHRSLLISSSFTFESKHSPPIPVRRAHSLSWDTPITLGVIAPHLLHGT